MDEFQSRGMKNSRDHNPASYAMLFLVLLCLVIAMIAGTCRRADAQPSTCEGIHDADRRNYCRAATQGKPSWCEFIKDHDLRVMCRETTRRKN